MLFPTNNPNVNFNHRFSYYGKGFSERPINGVIGNPDKNKPEDYHISILDDHPIQLTPHEFEYVLWHWLESTKGAAPCNFTATARSLENLREIRELKFSPVK